MKPWTTRSLMVLVFQVALLLFLVAGFIPGWQTSSCGPEMNKAQCVNNLKRIGMGIAAYTNAHGCFPPGTIPNPALSLDRRLGWGMAILPDLVASGMDPPESDLAQDEALRLASDDPALDKLAGQVSVASCPGVPGRANYVAIAGLGPDAPTLPKADPRAGIFGDDRVVTPADIKDGAANTMMLADTGSTGSPWFAGGRATVRGLDRARQPYIGIGRQFGGNHPTSRVALLARQGTMVILADGSVKFISESIDPKVFEAMSTMAGGEKGSDSGQE